MAGSGSRDEAVDADPTVPRAQPGADEAFEQRWLSLERIEGLERDLRGILDHGLQLLSNLAREAATHDAVAERDRLVERWHETEKRLLEESARRIHDFELRLQHEWEALRQLHEEPIRELESHGRALAETCANEIRTAQDAMARAESRLEGLEHAISRQVAEAASDFRGAVTALSGRSGGLPARERNTILGLVAGLVVLGAFTVVLYFRLDAANQRVAAAERQAIEAQRVAERGTAALRQSLQRANSDALSAATRAERMINVLADPDTRRLDLIGRRAAPAAAGQVLWSPSRGVVLVASRLPAPPDGQGYQVWLVTARSSISLGFVSPDAQGRLSAAFDVPPDLPDPVVGFMITVEPTGGSATPTIARVALAS